MATSYPIGSIVVLHNLIKGAEFNATKGIVRSDLNTVSGRQEVYFLQPKQTMSIKPSNMKYEPRDISSLSISDMKGLLRVSNKTEDEIKGWDAEQLKCTVAGVTSCPDNIAVLLAKSNKPMDTPSPKKDTQASDDKDELVKNRQLWKLLRLKVSKGVTSVKKSLSLPEGHISLDFGVLKVYKPLEKIKGVVKIDLKEAIHADKLTVTLKATRPIAAAENSSTTDKNFFDHMLASTTNKKTVFDETYEVCGSQVYSKDGHFSFEVIAPRLGLDPNKTSLVSSLVHELKNLDFTGAATWTMYASLQSPGGGLRSMPSSEYRIHIDD